ncbi:MAG: BMP family ABC transporter substrate-binding protein [Chloroflexota bacterium]|nr:MAG: BMP family ABC transporter substrate-binding protein [Chloroflexota bacterium]
MKTNSIYKTLAFILCAIFVLAACTTPATPATPTTAPEPTNPPIEPTAVPVVDTAPCLIVGALYGGPMNDAGYNQAMHESMVEMSQNISCVKLIEAENVPDEAGAKTTMENMISQGAKLIFATAFNHQNPAFELAEAHKDVIFEHAGGWMMSDNFANYFGAPPNGWYAMGVAAGLMTKTNKVGFVAAFPMGWTVTFINAFTLGARSVNPDVETIVAYTFNWGDRAKEADTTNSLINQGVDLITMHVDSPATIVSTAESRGVYSIGFQDLAAQQFAPEYWVTGTGFTLGPKITWLTQSVIDKTWEPIFLRCGVKDGCMAIAPFGSKVPQEVQDKVLQAIKDADEGKIVVFKGPIKDQTGAVKVAEGETLTDDVLSGLDWFVEGVVGSPK